VNRLVPSGAVLTCLVLLDACHAAGVYDIVEQTHKQFFASLGANVTIKKVRPPSPSNEERPTGGAVDTSMPLRPSDPRAISDQKHGISVASVPLW
jgi:hypothetical protein